MTTLRPSGACTLFHAGDYKHCAPNGAACSDMLPLREADATQQVGEAWVGAQATQTRVGLQPGQVNTPLTVSSLQPCERLLAVAERGVDGRHKVGHDVTVG